ncbi:GNAT family N-acetyltransferase [Erwinia phyllosphaerae]|uniref:GNAT family N-acetyltransferase n=1 Tax=Erwinia phyllosphaerae TaxID=2853256 RepID=UPI001FEE42CB|nr:GNAT family N-acetyltransferase [Erwinia phyllosphaerae]MBV4366393.1 GNAT family N-acetyltransferase [Erwinia phyllosphaerae]
MVRLARLEEAEALWQIRNQAVRYGCKEAYGEKAVIAWTPDCMPSGYLRAISQNPFFVIDTPGFPVATGFLDIKQQSVEAIFTLPAFMGNGYATQILEAIKTEARSRGIASLTLAATPNAVSFYQRHGFKLLRETLFHSALAGDLRCMDMQADLTQENAYRRPD